MANNTYTGGAYTLKGTVDPVNDIWLVQNSSTYFMMNRNVLLGVNGQPVDTTTTQTISGAKTLSAATLNSPTLSGTVTGTYTLGGTPTFPSSVVTLTGTQTLTNKTLTAPTITSPNISNASISADSISGFTTSNSGNIYGIAVSTAQITTANSIGTGTIVQNGVAASQLATTAITLGYTQITANPANITTTSPSQIPGLSVSVTIPSGGRRTEITVFVPFVQVGAAMNVEISIWDGTVGSGTKLSAVTQSFSAANNVLGFYVSSVVTPGAGSKTYNAGGAVSTNAATLNAGTTDPAYILVKAI